MCTPIIYALGINHSAAAPRNCAVLVRRGLVDSAELRNDNWRCDFRKRSNTVYWKIWLIVALCCRDMRSQDGLWIAGLLITALFQTVAVVNVEDVATKKSTTLSRAGNHRLFPKWQKSSRIARELCWIFVRIQRCILMKSDSIFIEVYSHDLEYHRKVSRVFEEIRRQFYIDIFTYSVTNDIRKLYAMYVMNVRTSGRKVYKLITPVLLCRKLGHVTETFRKSLTQCNSPALTWNYARFRASPQKVT